MIQGVAKRALHQWFTITHTHTSQQGAGNRQLEGMFVSERRPSIVVVSAGSFALEASGEEFPG